MQGGRVDDEHAILELPEDAALEPRPELSALPDITALDQQRSADCGSADDSRA